MRISDWSSDVCSSDLDPTHQHALVDCLHGDLGGRSIAEVAKVEENAASGSYRGRGLVTSPSARIVVVSRGRRRREIASRLAIITTPDFAIVNIGRASGRVRVWQYGQSPVVRVTTKKNNR